MNKLAETVFMSRSFLVMLAMLVVWLWDVSPLVSQFWPDLNDWLTIICLKFCLDICISHTVCQIQSGDPLTWSHEIDLCIFGLNVAQHSL